MRRWLLASLCIGCGHPARAAQVELLEDEIAQLVDLETGQAHTVRRDELPDGVREGDVIRGGRVDARATLELLRSVRAARERSRRAAPEQPLTVLPER